MEHLEMALNNFVMAHAALGTNMVQYYKPHDQIHVCLKTLHEVNSDLCNKTDGGYFALGLNWIEI